MAISQDVQKRVQQWLIGNFDMETKQTVRRMLQEDENLLIDSFYKDLEFGTGGLRGKLGIGTNRMNIYTVGRATQGLANYLKDFFYDIKQIKVVIAHDSRHNSRLFAETAANIFSANGIKTYLFDDLRPTPELSFAIRYLGCQAGIVITASHNPKEYNGYKVYWEDGAQIISPHDKKIMKYMDKIEYDQLSFTPNENLIHIIGEDIDNEYIKATKKIILSPAAIQDNRDIKIVYTPLHGTGIKLLPKMLEQLGFTNIYIIQEQAIIDGDFPTVSSPNPEDPKAMSLALEKAREINADLVLATDPDADRLGVAIKTNNQEFVLLNGNQVGSIFAYYLLFQYSQLGLLNTQKDFIVKTIVTTDLIREIAESYKVQVFETLTGFKYIGALIRELESERNFLMGAEESYGYLISDFVRDKDAISSAAFLTEILAWAKQNGKTLFDVLIEIYVKYNLYHERLVTLIKEGIDGEREIKRIMEKYRNEHIKKINGQKVIFKKDFLLGFSYDYLNAKQEKINLPQSDVIQFVLENNTKISIRPSGTEPKIKFYFSVNEKLDDKKNYSTKVLELENRIDSLQIYFNL